MKGKFSECIIFTLFCALVLYAGMRNLCISIGGESDSAGINLLNAFIWCCTGIIYFAAVHIYSRRNKLDARVLIPLMYLAAPFIAGLCIFNGLNGILLTETLLVIPAAAVHVILALVFRLRKKA